MSYSNHKIPNVVEYIYLIEMRKELSKWFFLNATPITDPTVVQRVFWTPRLAKAHIFTSEQHVEEFKSSYINPRKVSIIRMKPLEALITL